MKTFPGAIFVTEKKHKDGPVSRRDKLAAELRANLKRRKERARSVGKGKPATNDNADDTKGR